jgi:chromosome segregation ATPase
MAVICLNCEGWGCAQCKLERQAAAGGEQGPTAEDLDLIALRHERDTFKGLADDLTKFLGERIAELETEVLSMRHEAISFADLAEKVTEISKALRDQRNAETERADRAEAVMHAQEERAKELIADAEADRAAAESEVEVLRVQWAAMKVERARIINALDAAHAERDAARKELGDVLENLDLKSLNEALDTARADLKALCDEERTAQRMLDVALGEGTPDDESMEVLTERIPLLVAERDCAELGLQHVTVERDVALAEVERLRKQMASMASEAGYPAQLERENARLRTLIKQAERTGYNTAVCPWCSHSDRPDHSNRTTWLHAETCPAFDARTGLVREGEIR